VIQKIVSKLTTPNGNHFALYDTKVLVAQFEIDHFDLELEGASSISQVWQDIIGGLPNGVTMRFTSSTDYTHDDYLAGTSRDGAVAQTGYLSSKLLVSFEKPMKTSQIWMSFFRGSKSSDMELRALCFEFEKQIPSLRLESKGITLKPKEFTEPKLGNNIKLTSQGLKDNSGLSTVVKLNKLSTYPVDVADLAVIRETIPHPSSVVTSIQKVPEGETQLFIKKISRSEGTGTDITSARKYEDSQRAIEEVDLGGNTIFRFETFIILDSPNAEVAADNARVLVSELKKLGDFGIETFGVLECIKSALPGGPMHLPNFEFIDRIPTYLPVAFRGFGGGLKISDRSLLFHRRNFSVDQFDLFDKEHKNFSAYVTGISGKGKSVFVNTLIQSLSNDPHLRLILVDVKGSHTNTVKKLEGNVHTIGTDSPKMLSPFDFLSQRRDNAIKEILSDHIEKVLLEDDERSLSRTEQANVEKHVSSYVDKNPKNPSLDDFYKRSPGLCRLENLERWVSGGIYSDVFKRDSKSSFEGNRIEYFDFTNILTAQKGGVGTVIMSSIMAYFNFLLLSKKTKEKLVFIADETPFFVESCFSSFNLLMKNVRKLNGSLILVAQNLSDLRVNGNSSLLSQPEIKIFFSKDDGSEEFLINSRLSAEEVAMIDSLQFQKGKSSEFLLKTPVGSRIGTLLLSYGELLKATTDPNDSEKIENFQNLLGLESSLDAVEILAEIGDRYEISL